MHVYETSIRVPVQFLSVVRVRIPEFKIDDLIEKGVAGTEVGLDALFDTPETQKLLVARRLDTVGKILIGFFAATIKHRNQLLSQRFFRAEFVSNLLEWALFHDFTHR